MSEPPDRTPLYADAYELCQWLLGHFDDDDRTTLARNLCQCALELLEAVILALSGRRIEEQVERADERLILLRTLLRLAWERGSLDMNQFEHSLRLADSIGRQIGGWLGKMGPV